MSTTTETRDPDAFDDLKAERKLDQDDVISPPEDADGSGDAGAQTAPPEPEATDDPPKRAKRRRRRRSPASAGKLASYKQIREGLDGFIGMIGTGIIIAGDQYCGTAVLDRGPALADALVEVARVNPRVRRSLSSLTRGSVWGGVFVAGASIALPIMYHHGLIPPNVAAVMGIAPSGAEVGAGGAPDAHRPDGAGQDDARPGDTAAA